MKIWFVFLINGEKVGTWANNTDEAVKNLIAEYGNVPMKYIGIYWGNKLGAEPDRVTRKGMSALDVAIASGLLKMFVGLR